MARRILLSTYNIKVSNPSVNDVLLDQFDGKSDFVDFFNEFTTEVFKNVKKQASYNDRSVLHLTLDEPATFDKDSRTIYGYISSGVNEDKFTVRASDEKKFESNPETDITFRSLFFYLQVPRGKTYAYLIIQKKRDLGGKNSLEKALRSYLTEKGYSGYNVSINNLLNARVYDKMMTQGNLKKIDFIKRTIPDTIEELVDQPKKEYTQKGTLTTTIKSRTTLSKYWKEYIHKIFVGINKNATIELNDSNEVDEIEFELELKGKIKTFHVIHKNRTWPDIDVTSDVIFENNIPTTESLVSISNDLINDILTLSATK